MLDNDYAGFSGVPVDLMRVTMAHEYNHILQFGYDVFQDGWMFESTATFMEDYVFADVNDYINFMPQFVKSSKTPLAEEEARAFKLYGSAVWNHFIASRHGARGRPPRLGGLALGQAEGLRGRGLRPFDPRQRRLGLRPGVRLLRGRHRRVALVDVLPRLGLVRGHEAQRRSRPARRG